MFSTRSAACLLLLLQYVAQTTTSFVLLPRYPSHTVLLRDSRSDDGPFDSNELEHRLQEMRIQLMEAEVRMPPNPKLSPKAFVAEIIQRLRNNGDPMPDAGFRSLIRSSTGAWKEQLYHSVGAPSTAGLDVVATALGEAMSREVSQFGILVGEGEVFDVLFPTDTVDYGDGKCWVETRFLSAEDDELLVIIGWQLEQRQEDGAWLIDSIDWQDFRDQFRPGIGREEWERICG